MEKISILLADDHQLIRETWKYIVYKENGQVILSGSKNLKAGMDNSINLPGTIAKGYYILQLIGEKTNHTQKILVQ